MHFGATSWSEHGFKMALCRALCRFIYHVSMEQSRNNYVINLCFMYIYWWLSDYYNIEKQKQNRPLANLSHHRVRANCRFAAEPLHDYMSAQMTTRLTLRSLNRKKRSLYLTLTGILHNYSNRGQTPSRGYVNAQVEALVSCYLCSKVACDLFFEDFSGCRFNCFR